MWRAWSFANCFRGKLCNLHDSVKTLPTSLIEPAASGSPEREIRQSKSSIYCFLICISEIIVLFQNGTRCLDALIMRLCLSEGPCETLMYSKHIAGAACVHWSRSTCNHSDCDVVRTVRSTTNVWLSVCQTHLFITRITRNHKLCRNKTINCVLVILSIFLSDKSMMLSFLIPRITNTQTTSVWNKCRVLFLFFFSTIFLNF